MNSSEAPNAPLSPRPGEGAVSSALRRWGGWLRLWLDPEYRRGFYRLLAVELRVMLGMRLAFAGVILAACAGWIVLVQLPDAAGAWRFLGRVFSVIAILLAAPIFASEQRQGTFELVWLATGSRATMLGVKAFAIVAAQLAMAAPCVLLLSRFLGGSLPFGGTMWCLFVTILFVTGLLAWLGTYLTQPWAGGLAGIAILGPVIYLMEDWDAKLNLFASPLQPANVAVGRSVALVLGLLFLHLATQRMRHVMRD